MMNVDCNVVQLKESEERYQHLVQLLPDALIVFNDDHIVFANASALKLIGVNRPEDIIGQSIYRFVHPRYVNEMPAQIQYLLREAHPTYFVHTKLIRTNREPVDVEMRAVAVKYDGKPSVQLIIRDISDRKRMEASLDEKEYLYKSLVESVVAGVFVGYGNNVVFCNPCLAEMYGYTVEEMLTLAPHELLDGNELIKIKKNIRDAMVNGKKQFPIKCRGIKKDGSTIFLEGNGTIIMFNGHLSLLGTVQDVTFKHEQECMLRDSAKLYQKMIKFVPEPIVVSDEGIVVYVNKLAMQMIGACEDSEVIGKSVFQFIHACKHERVVETMKQVMSTDDPTPYQERVIVCPDGRLLDVEISSIRINNYMGKDVILSVIRDLTERKRSEEMLVRSEKLSVIGQLAAGVAHEIRNPLTALKGFTQLLRNKYPEQQHYFEIMAAEIDRIALIVNEFMTLAKPHFSQFNSAQLEPILQSVIHILETQAILLNVTIVFQHEEPLPVVYCNENQLKQVFLNVIKNAIEAMPEGGEVVIHTEQTDNGEVQIRIKDGGPGIPEELIKKIGEPFVTTKEKGTGLGLMISTRIIEAHRGTLQISSVINEGTVVQINLPVQELTAVVTS
ncbi:PAS domain S-box protein [Paenibacillus alkaliterrae]|uniref:PAS domain S-box protein n=1 Tax=Paenibacillus alkaliterrae TaxID=320909 RepID=UPI001F1E2AED|nr:PAS domain S-box protein [Paenibacillus alkaliterrae]MCF2938622.1 PAS domain S-box protein [Paenibacillus alkaliterrae]